LILASGVAWGHSGHEAIGNVLHIEYLLAASASVAIGIYGLMRHKRDGED
jgi:hypothetical protein